MSKPNCRKRKVKALELVDCDVKAVSLVDRGAIRTPFRRFKSEKTEEGDMGISIEFDSVVPQDEKTKSQLPRVVAVVTGPGLDVEKAIEAVKGQGFAHEPHLTIDGCAVFMQDPKYVLTGKETKLKLSDQACVLLDGTITKATTKGMFAERIAQNAFYPGISAACATLESTLCELAWGATSSPGGSGFNLPDKAKEALGEFDTYVMTMIREVPTAAYKAEKITGIPEASTIEEQPAEKKVDPAVVIEKPVEKAEEKAEEKPPTLAEIMAGMKTVVAEEVKASETRTEEKINALKAEVDETRSTLVTRRSRIRGLPLDREDPKEREKQDDEEENWGVFDTGLAELMREPGRR